MTAVGYSSSDFDYFLVFSEVLLKSWTGITCAEGIINSWAVSRAEEGISMAITLLRQAYPVSAGLGRSAEETCTPPGKYLNIMIQGT